jgi:threonine synthase
MTTNAPKFDYTCYGCGSVKAQLNGSIECERCGEPMAVRALANADSAIFDAPPQSMWTYFDLLPIRDPSSVVSLGEGATKLIEAPSLAKKTGAGQITLKLELANPTGSFKDRQISVGISHARERGIDTVAVVSSGNVACAASAYAARAGMRAVLMMHGLAGKQKTAQAAAYGGRVVMIDAPPSSVFDLCIAACKEFGWYHLSTAGMYEPYNVEGAKTIAYEIYQQTAGKLPDWIVAPVGGGGLLGGIWRGFLDLQRLGLIDKPPRLAGVQAAGCAPLKKAIDNDTPYLDTLKEPWPNPHSVAGGIADDILFDGHTVLPAIRRTNGAAIAVTDDEIIEGELLLASSEGVLCEPSTAVVVAALKYLPGVTQSSRICCIISGTGIKDLPAIQDRVRTPARCKADIAEIARAVGGNP